MKITHNKVGQNINLVDGAKSDKASQAKGKSNSALSPAAGEIGDSAKVEVSPRAQQAKKIKELAMAAPEVDLAKVEKFRKMIDEGKYAVDAKAVAEKMVDEQAEMNN